MAEWDPNTDPRRCTAVAENGHRCLLVKHNDNVQHCTIGGPPEHGNWLFWPKPEPTLQEKLRAKIAAMSDNEVERFWKKIQELP